MKLSVSLSDTVAGEIGRFAKSQSATTSLVVEAAIRAFLDLGPTEQTRALQETTESKKVTTPNSWRRVFWATLASEFQKDAAAEADANPFAPRTHERYTVVFLLPNLQGIEDGTLTVHAFENPIPSQPNRSSQQLTKTYRLEDSVYRAARETAAWIKAQSTSPA